MVELAAYLQRKGQRATVLTYHPGNFFSRKAMDAEVPVIQLPKRGRLDPFFPGRLLRWVTSNRVDVLHAFLVGPVLWSSLALAVTRAKSRPALVLAERNILDGARTWELLVKHVAFRSCDLITVNSKIGCEEIGDRLGIPSRKVVYIPNGIDVEAWRQAALGEPDVALEPGAFNLALIGRFVRQKNHALVLEALSKLGPSKISNWRVWFVGEGGDSSSKAAIEREIERRRLKRIVRILDPISDIAPFLQRIDGVLLPSAREGFSNVILESMAVGVPAVASRVGSTPEMIDDGQSGLVLENLDAQTLSLAMETLAMMPPQNRAEMGRRARALAEERYSMPMIGARYLEVYRSVLDQGLQG